MLSSEIVMSESLFLIGTLTLKIGFNCPVKRIGIFLLATALLPIAMATPGVAGTVAIQGHVQGATLLIENVTISGLNTSTLRYIKFTVTPKSGATAQPISATYSPQYLASVNPLWVSSNQVVLPVFGLYGDYLNSVVIKVYERSRTTSLTTTIQTNQINTSYTNPTKIKARDRAVSLDYSYFYMKDMNDGYNPVVIDVDGNIRWVGTTGIASQSSIFINNQFFVGSGASLYQNNLDGSHTLVASYNSSPNYVTNISHHNYDPGKEGILLEVDTNNGVASHVESTIIEVALDGRVLRTFDLSTIIANEMLRAGDSQNTVNSFVINGADWFHNNSATYWPSRNELVLSAREDFVIAIDYRTSKIKWILGDPNKYWYQHTSLKKFALRLTSGIYPIGQHGLSISSSNQLLLFDNDLFGWSHGNPDGVLNPVSPALSAPRMYSINSSRMTVVETWSYLASPAIYSPICSSIYQDGTSFLIDYASNGIGGMPQGPGSNYGEGPQILGVDRRGKLAFHYYYSGWYGLGWNAAPIHLESLSFIAPLRNSVQLSRIQDPAQSLPKLADLM